MFQKACIAKNSARDYETNRGKIFARPKLNRKHKLSTKIPYTANRRA